MNSLPVFDPILGQLLTNATFVQFSSDHLSWHTKPVGGDIYIRVSVDKVNWTLPMGIGDIYYKGVFATSAALISAYPTGEIGWNAKVTSTGTYWVWDADTNAWLDSDRKGQVSSVGTYTGDVTKGQLGIGCFLSAFTSTASTGFVWSSNTLTITHNLGTYFPTVRIQDANKINCAYSFDPVDVNSIVIYFPVALIPITGTWTIQIFQGGN